ncbi:MAG: hypothetical protein IKZ71_02890 [Bacteroidales bacterium]|nr:hypothetical protein [Bacteroidales bacterium]
MKRFYYYLGIIGFSLITITACYKDSNISSNLNQKESLKLNLTIKYESDSETKGKKAGWESGDKIFLFFNGVTSGYLTITYDGMNWDDAALNGLTIDELSESGSTLTAIFLPFGNDAVPTYTTKWVFDKGFDTYYLRAAKQSYTLTKVNGITTLTATLAMAQPGRFCQFFVPDESATGTALFSCNNIRPQGLGSVSSSGSCNNLNDTANSGELITGYAGTIGGEKGYYFYGTPYNDAPKLYKLYYYFTFEKDGVYYDYLKIGTSEISDKSAVKLPSMNRVGVGYYSNNTLGGYTWATVNYGASKPWEYESTQYEWPGSTSSEWENTGLTQLAGRGEAVPTASQLEALCSVSVKFRIMAGGVVGYLLYDTGTKGYLFLPMSGRNEGKDVHKVGYYWSSTEYDGSNGVYLSSDAWTAPHIGDYLHQEKTKKLSVRPIKL